MKTFFIFSIAILLLQGCKDKGLEYLRESRQTLEKARYYRMVGNQVAADSCDKRASELWDKYCATEKEEEIKELKERYNLE